MIGSIHQLETVERLIRRGIYTGPLVLNHMALGGGYAGRNPSDMLEFVRRCPDGAVLTIESLMRTVTADLHDGGCTWPACASRCRR